jgi:hypothetical protein
VESEIRKVHLGQNEDQREQKQFEDKQGPTPPLHETPTIAGQKLIQASRYVNSEGNHLKGQVPQRTADRGFACRPEKVHAIKEGWQGKELFLGGRRDCLSFQRARL